MSETNKETTPIIEILEKSGKYQYFQYFLVSLSTIFVSLSTVNYVFIAGDADYRCKIPECESPDQLYRPKWWPNEKIDRCTRPILNITLYESSHTCTNKSFTEEVQECTEFVYETNDTIIAEFNLGCQLWKQNMVGTIHGVGMIVAMSVAGWITDRFGRKLAIIIFSVAGLLGNLKVLATSYPMYMVFEFLEATLSSGIMSTGTVIMIEISSTKNRMLAGVIFAYAIYTGEALYACLGMVATNWKTFVLIIYSPCILFLSFIFLMEESPRWQIVNGKIKDAKETLNLMAKMNKLNINRDELENIDESKLKEMFNLEKEEIREGYIEVFRSVEMIKRLAMGIVGRFTVSFIYYSLLINSIYLPGNKYTNFLLAAVASYPGEVLSLFLMKKFGRRLPLIYGFIFCGITSIAGNYIPDDFVWLKITIFLVGKIGIAVCYTGTETYTMELFPTSVRGSMLSLCTLSSCVGNLVAPLIPSLTAISPILPPLCFGCTALASSGLLFLTPETSRLPLPDTIKQVENNSLAFEEPKISMSNISQDNLGYEPDI